MDEHYRLYAFPVDLGSYTLTVQGTPALLNSGFTGQLVFSAGDIPNPSAVPEPGTSVLLMTGLGVIGFAMRRSRGQRTLAKCASTWPDPPSSGDPDEPDRRLSRPALPDGRAGLVVLLGGDQPEALAPGPPPEQQHGDHGE